MSVTKSFTAVGDGPELLVRHGERFTYEVAGTFVGTVRVQQFVRGGWTNLASLTAPGEAEVILDSTPKPHARVRFRCSAFTSGTIVTTLDPETSEVLDRLTLPSGEVVGTLSEEGLTLPDNKQILASQVRDGSGSFQTVAIDLEIADAGGSDDGTDPDFLAPMMGHVTGADVAGEGNYIGGVIGASSITAPVSDYPVAPLLGILMDGGAGHDSIVHAHIDGSDPSAATNANAAFGVSMANNHADSGVNFGLDLKGDANAHISSGRAFDVKVAEIRFSKDNVCVLVGDGAPTSGASGTGDNVAGIGSLYIDHTNGNLYVQVGVITSPDWKLVTRAA